MKNISKKNIVTKKKETKEMLIKKIILLKIKAQKPYSAEKVDVEEIAWDSVTKYSYRHKFMYSNRLISLNEILQYKNQKVLNRYKKDFPQNSLTPELAFEELLKFFWLSHKHKIDIKQSPHTNELKFVCTMHKEMEEIDNMWHTFLLFTKDYMSFCNKYFKCYIHHNPFDKNIIELEKDFIDELTKYLSYIYDNLGEETLIKWFKLG